MWSRMAHTAWLLSATLLILLSVTDATTAALGPPPAVVFKNGIGLEGGVLSGNIVYGRLLVSSTDLWVTNGTKGAVYRTVCDDSFNDDTAKTMCSLLGYNYGRKYYGGSVTYRQGATAQPLGYLSCHKESSAHRRSLMGADDSSHQQGHSRSLTSMLLGYVDLPKKNKNVCTFTMGDCPAIGPLAGVQCSNKTLPPAPSPPPSPPNPPPAPPPKSNYLRMYGGNVLYSTSVESNICNQSANKDCRWFGRVEVQVAGAGGKPVWAPLCAPKAGSTLADQLGRMVCLQLFDWDPVADGSHGIVGSSTSATPFKIPSGKVNATGDFSPAQYTRWATVTGGNFTTAKKVQDLTLKVTAAQCSTGAMLAVHCEIALTRKN